jgi:hypothetical protein
MTVKKQLQQAHKGSKIALLTRNRDGAKVTCVVLTNRKGCMDDYPSYKRCPAVMVGEAPAQSEAKSF